MTSREHEVIGYTPPGKAYFDNAIRYFLGRFNKSIHFIVCTDDFSWTTTNVVLPTGRTKTSPSAPDVTMTYSRDRTTEVDLAILSMCYHVIMSCGTFGWWAGWLANGRTIYYKNWPRKSTQLYEMFKHEDFYPPSWIPLE